MKDAVKIKGIIEFEIRGRDGKIRDKWTEYNAVVNAGFAQLALLAGDATATPFTYLALGTSTTAVAVGQTALQAEIVSGGLERAAATVSRVTTNVANDTLQLVKVFTASASHASWDSDSSRRHY